MRRRAASHSDERPLHSNRLAGSMRSHDPVTRARAMNTSQVPVVLYFQAVRD